MLLLLAILTTYNIFFINEKNIYCVVILTAILISSKLIIIRFLFRIFFLIKMISLFSSDYLFKLLLIGDSGVGKSCLLLRFAVRIKFLFAFFAILFFFCYIRHNILYFTGWYIHRKLHKHHWSGFCKSVVIHYIYWNFKNSCFFFSRKSVQLI